MNNIDWSQLDDYLFVKLVGDLLARLGFVDVDYQGDGPDGGVDLFATELLPFTIQGRIPFRWAIQCKFSVRGVAASVNDSEVRDVEGILRSERYQAQESRGYMLVTNRRIVQNVVERLRGIDRKSQFRTARIDGPHLESLLSEHPELAERYLGEKRYGPSGLGKPAVIVSPASGTSRLEPPSILVELGSPDGTRTLPEKVRAILDTGASMSVIPEEVVNKLALPAFGEVNIHTPSGGTTLRSFMVRIGVERVGYFTVQVVAVDMPTVVIGRDILGRFSVLIRPDGGLELYKI